MASVQFCLMVAHFHDNLILIPFFFFFFFFFFGGGGGGGDGGRGRNRDNFRLVKPTFGNFIPRLLFFFNKTGTLTVFYNAMTVRSR